MIELSRNSAIALCDALDLNSEFFDEENEDYIILKDSNPNLFQAYTDIFTIAYAEEAVKEFDNSISFSFEELDYLIDNIVETTDMGPCGEGWKSQKLKDLISKLEKAAGE